MDALITAAARALAAGGLLGVSKCARWRAYQQRAGMAPADGYAGVKLLARLRQGL